MVVYLKSDDETNSDRPGLLVAGAVAFVVARHGTGGLNADRPASLVRGVVVSTVSRDGELRCSASIPSAALAPGEPTGILFRLTNLTARTVTAPVLGDLIISDPHGHPLRSASESVIRDYGHVPVAQRTLEPGGEVQFAPIADPIVRWPGLLLLKGTSVELFGGVRLP